MSQFVSQENQSLLWKLLNKSPIFGNQPEPMKNEVFRTMISRQYDTLGAPSAPIDYKSLQQLNKETIRMVLNVFQEVPNRTTPDNSKKSDTTPIRPGYGPGLEPQPSMLYKDHTGTVLPEPVDDTQHVFLMQEQTSREFSQLQHEYQQMGAKPMAPDTSVFQANEYQTDEAIQNLDELLLQYQNERQNDLLPIAPPPEEPKAPTNKEEEESSAKVPSLESSSSSSSSSSVKEPPRSLEQQFRELEVRVQYLEQFMQELRDNYDIPMATLDDQEPSPIENPVEDTTPVMFVRVSPEDGHEIDEMEEMQEL